MIWNLRKHITFTGQIRFRTWKEIANRLWRTGKTGYHPFESDRACKEYIKRAKKQGKVIAATW